MRIRKRRRRVRASWFVVCGWVAACASAQAPPPLPPVLGEIDRIIREKFFDPKLKGRDWGAAVAKAAAELARDPAPSAPEQNAIYDRLLSTLQDSHTFRVPAGKLPERHWATAGLRIGRDADGYAVKGVVPASAADRAGLRIGDRVLSVDGKAYGRDRVSFRDLFFVFEGFPGTSVEVTWQSPGEPPRTEKLVRMPEEPGETLVWKSARVVRRGGKSYGYARLWGMSAETALAVVDMLSDRAEIARSRPALAGFDAIDGFLLDVRGNSGGYEPNILPTFLRGRWSAADYYLITRDAKRLSPPEYKPLPVALLTNSGTASAGEALALKFQAHGIGPVVGESTAGMMSGGATAERLPDASMLWYTARSIEGLDGKTYEGQGVEPDVAVADRRRADEGQEDPIIDAAVKALSSR
jgi:carboxyl-terminal processing protease